MKWWQITFSHGGCIYKDDDDGTMIHISHFVTHVTFAFCKVFACVWPTIYLEAKVWHFVVKIWYKLKKKIAYIFSPFYCQFSTFFSHFSTFFVIFNLFVFFFFQKNSTFLSNCPKRDPPVDLPILVTIFRFLLQRCRIELQKSWAV